MKRYVIVNMLQPVAVGYEFSAAAWPLHVTIIPWFHNIDIADATKIVDDIASSHHVLDMKAASREFFGSRNNIAVTLLATNPTMQRIHDAFLAALIDHGAVLLNGTYVGSKYRAHVTDQRNDRLHPGDTIGISNLTLVEQFQGSQESGRRVCHVTPLAPT
jgi:hypothetical protein